MELFAITTLYNPPIYCLSYRDRKVTNKLSNAFEFVLIG